MWGTATHIRIRCRPTVFEAELGGNGDEFKLLGVDVRVELGFWAGGWCVRLRSMDLASRFRIAEGQQISEQVGVNHVAGRLRGRLRSNSKLTGLPSLYRKANRQVSLASLVFSDLLVRIVVSGLRRNRQILTQSKAWGLEDRRTSG